MGNQYSNLYPDPSAVGARALINSSHKAARVRCDYVIAPIGSSNLDAGDKVFLTKLPSHAILLPQGQIHWPGITSATNVTLGDDEDPNGLAAAFSMASAGDKSLLAAITRDLYGRKLWEHLGYSEDPNTDILLYLYFTDGTGAASKTITGTILYTLD